MFSLAFWRATTERAIRTIAQALLSLWLVGDVMFNALTVDWGEALGVGLGAGIISVLMSLVADWAAPATGPSLGTEKPVNPGTRRAQSGQIDAPLAVLITGALILIAGIGFAIAWVTWIGGILLVLGFVMFLTTRLRL